MRLQEYAVGYEEVVSVGDGEAAIFVGGIATSFISLKRLKPYFITFDVLPKVL